jgi:hypothetical protein
MPITWYPYNQYVRATDDLALRITDVESNFRIPVFPSPWSALDFGDGSWTPIDVDVSFTRLVESGDIRLLENGRHRLLEGDLWTPIDFGEMDWTPLDINVSFPRLVESGDIRLTEDGRDRLVEGDLWEVFLTYRTIHEDA